VADLKQLGDDTSMSQLNHARVKTFQAAFANTARITEAYQLRGRHESPGLRIAVKDCRVPGYVENETDTGADLHPLPTLGQKSHILQWSECGSPESLPGLWRSVGGGVYQPTWVQGRPRGCTKNSLSCRRTRACSTIPTIGEAGPVTTMPVRATSCVPRRN
jgi:hypothetical protein